MSKFNLLSLLLLGVSGLTACAISSTPHQTSSKTAQKYWPDFPVMPRYVHEASLRLITDIAVPDRNTRLKNLLAGAPPPEFAFLRPYDIAARFGRIYISDPDASAISVYDVPRRRFYRLGMRLAGKLVKPMGVALDAQSNLYVADTGSASIQVFDFLGMHRITIGQNDQLQLPLSVAVDAQGENIYVVDNGGISTNLHRILQYDSTGNLLKIIGQRGDKPGEFNLPTDAVVGSDGTLYVLDSGNFRVQAFDTEGNFMSMWGSAGSGLGQLARPRSIAIDQQDNLYITDMFFGNFQVFNRQGALLLPLGKIDPADQPGHFRLISGITVDETQRVYVVDQLFKKVEVFRHLKQQESEQLLKQYKQS